MPNPAKVELKYDSDVGKGTVLIEDGSYGPYIAVNGEGVAAVDLYHLAEEGKNELGEYFQLVIYAPGEDDPICHIMYLKGKVVFEFERTGRGAMWPRISHDHKNMTMTVAVDED